MYENLERCDSAFVSRAKVRISLQTLQINHHQKIKFMVTLCSPSKIEQTKRLN